MMATDDDTLVTLHNRWLREFDSVLEAGATLDDAAESMLTIAISNRLRVDGPRATAARLMMIADLMTTLANQQAMDGDGDPRTRH